MEQPRGRKGGREMAVSVRESRGRHSVVAAALIAGATALVIYFATSGGGSSTAAAAEGAAEPPATIKPIGKTGRSIVNLSESAAKRLGIETAPVSTSVVDGRLRVVIPYSAVLYDARGNAWTYTMAKPLSFFRTDVDVDAVRGDVAVLSHGPSPNTRVLTVGATEVWGVEYGGIEEAPEASGD
jgi:hypothetical protein